MTGEHKYRLLFIPPRVMGTFVRQDFELLQKDFDVEMWRQDSVGSILRLLGRIRRADAVFIWFAGRHAVLPVALARLMQVPVATVIGGYEVEWIPEVEYGVPPDSRWWTMVRWILKRSTAILTVSEASQRSATLRLPSLTAKMQRVYNCVDTSQFTFRPDQQRDGILTVARFDAQTISSKGLELFWKTAARMPEQSFIAVGPAMDDAGTAFVADCPPNLRWLGQLHGNDLIAEYQRSSVYFLGSMHESFSLATAEAMACGCVPVVSRAGALPEVVGQTGVMIEERTPEAASDAIRAALKLGHDARHKARARIVERFAVDIRRHALRLALIAMIESHCKDRP